MQKEKKLTENQKRKKLADLKETEAIVRAVLSHYTSIHKNYHEIRGNYQKEIQELQKKILLLDHNYQQAPQKIAEAQRDLKEIDDKRAGLKNIMGKLEKLKKLKDQVRRLEAELCSKSSPYPK